MSSHAIAYFEPVSESAPVERSFLPLAGLIAFHALLATAMRTSASLATLCSVLTVVAAMGVALFASRTYWIACAAAYLAGSEVLWRMTGAGGPWELGKAAIAVVLLTGMIRLRRYTLPFPAVLYAMLLLPGALITCFRMIYASPWPRLTTHLSGPLALAACVCFFMNWRPLKRELDRILLALALPVTGVCYIAASGTFTREIHFGSQSLHAASGDFGPNQVASILGLGAAVTVLYLLSTPTGLWRKLLLALVVVACVGQSALTLSRGGVYAFVGALIPAFIFLAGDRKARRRTVLIAASFAVLAVTFVYPFLNEYTGGALEKRFSEKGMSGRERLVNIDLEIWFGNPLFGIGVGRSQFVHPSALMSHNEFTRTLAEHGSLGLAAMCVLVLIALQRVGTAQRMQERALCSALFTWAFLFLYVNGMRLAAPAFVFGLATAALRYPAKRDPAAG